MANRVFVLTDSDYSDYAIRRVVTDEAVAQRLAKAFGWDVETWAVDDIDTAGWPDAELYRVTVCPRLGDGGRVNAYRPDDVPTSDEREWRETGWDAVARETTIDQWGRLPTPDNYAPTAARTDWFASRDEALAAGRIKLAEMQMELAALGKR